jgi:hypothetical protein
METFDVAGSWMAGEGANAAGSVKDGVYVMALDEFSIDDRFWTSGGLNFADAVYEVDAMPASGADDNGYGMLFRVDSDADRFYIFKVSSDGYVFIALCNDGCAEQEMLVDRDWFASPAVIQGFGSTNTLRVVADGPEMEFFVNDIAVGRARDEALINGDIGLFGETFVPGGLRVAFDNFKVTPLTTE